MCMGIHAKITLIIENNLEMRSGRRGVCGGGKRGGGELQTRLKI